MQRSSFEKRKVIIAVLFGVAGFFLNLLPLDIHVGGIQYSILIGLFPALLITQVWGLKYGLIAALSGSTQTMWFKWLGDGYGIFYAVPVFTFWIVWHGIWADKRAKTENPPFYYSKYFQEIVIRFIIELGFWTIFPLLVSKNPPAWNPAAVETVTDKFLFSIAVKHTANAYIMLMVIDCITSLKRVRKFFGLKANNGRPRAVFLFVLLWTVIFWFSDAVIHDLFFDQIKSFYNTVDSLPFMAIMFTDYPISNFLLRLVFFGFSFYGAVLISGFYKRQREREKKYKSLFEHSNDIILLFKSDGCVVELNETGLTLFKPLKKEKKQMWISDLIPEKQFSEFSKLLSQREEFRLMTEITVRKQTYKFDWMVSCIDRNKALWQGVVRDITEMSFLQENLRALNQELNASYEELEASYEELETNNELMEQRNASLKKMQDELKIAYRKLNETKNNYKSLYKESESIIDSVPEFILKIDSDYNILWANKAFTDEYSNDVIGRKSYEIFAKRKTPCDVCKLTESLQKNETMEFENKIDENHYFLEICIPDNTGGEAVLLVRDIVKEKMREKHLVEAKEAQEEANRVKDNFLANISHELRTPMNGIILSTQLIQEECECGQQINEYLKMIEDSSNRLMRTINAILDINRLQKSPSPINPETFSITSFTNKLMNDLKSFADEKKIVFESAIDESVPDTIETDREKLYQILSNITYNAIKFTEKGHVRFEIRRLSDDSKKHNPVLQFIISDTGIGIPEKKQEAIFKKFTQVDNSLTRKYEGSGLGLSISKSLADMLGARLFFESTTEEQAAADRNNKSGTRFYLELMIKAPD